MRARGLTPFLASRVCRIRSSSSLCGGEAACSCAKRLQLAAMARRLRTGLTPGPIAATFRALAHAFAGRRATCHAPGHRPGIETIATGSARPGFGDIPPHVFKIDVVRTLFLLRRKHARICRRKKTRHRNHSSRAIEKPSSSQTVFFFHDSSIAIVSAAEVKECKI